MVSTKWVLQKGWCTVGMVRKLPGMKWNLDQTLKKMDRILIDGERGRGENVVGREEHSRRRVQSTFQHIASGLVWVVNSYVGRNWTKVDRTIP